MQYSFDQLRYGGELHQYLWDPDVNVLADVTNCVADCTALTLGLSIKDVSQPCSPVKSASQWHKYLINGWTAIPFDRAKVKKGDIIEWVEECHVAVVDRVDDSGIFLHCSWYTGEHGVSKYNDHYDTRGSFSNTQEVSDFMSVNYPTRFYHYWNIEDESNGVGGQPDYILVAPTIYEPAGKDETRDQIEVLTNEQNVRDRNMNIVGVARAGYYNVLSTMKDDTYTWYEVEDNRYIAGVNGRVVYHEAEADIKALKKLIAKQQKLIADYQTRMNDIHVLSGE